MIAQLDLFKAFEPEEREPEFNWSDFFPEYTPKVGGYASFHHTMAEDRITGERYVNIYMAELKITAIEGRNVDAVGVSRLYYPNCERHIGKVYRLTMNDLWPAVYINDEDINENDLPAIEVVTPQHIADYEASIAKYNKPKKKKK